MNHELFTTSEEVAGLFAALAKAQGSMGPALKDAKNPHFRSSYASLASVLEAILPHFNANGLALTQHPGFADGVVTLTTIISHSSGQWMSSTVASPLARKQDAQAVGSAITYLRRYAAQSIAGLPVEDDDGNRASARPPRPSSVVPTQPKPLTAAELGKRLERLDLTLRDMVTYCEENGKPVPQNMTAARQQQMLSWLAGAGAAQVRTWFAAQEMGGEE